MSDSESFNSAKDDLDAPAPSDGDSWDEPAKGKVGRKPKAAAKSLKKNGKQSPPKKAGRPPGKSKAIKPGRGRPKSGAAVFDRGCTVIGSPKGNKARGRPPSKGIKAEKQEKSFSGDPLELSDVDPLNGESDDDEEKEYEVTFIHHSSLLEKNLQQKIPQYFRSKPSLGTLRISTARS